jgi:hypothetical protein
VNRPGHHSPEPQAETSPSAGQPIVGRKGLTIPWAWITSLLPLGGLGGAVLHSELFGAPPEFAKRLDAQAQRIESAEGMLHELHESAALGKQQMQHLSEDMKRVREVLDSLNHRIP